MFFLLFFFGERRIRIRIREAKKHMDPTYPDPQHCRKPFQSNLQRCGSKFRQETTASEERIQQNFVAPKK